MTLRMADVGHNDHGIFKNTETILFLADNTAYGK